MAVIDVQTIIDKKGCVHDNYEFLGGDKNLILGMHLEKQHCNGNCTYDAKLGLGGCWTPGFLAMAAQRHCRKNIMASEKTITVQ